MFKSPLKFISVIRTKNDDFTTSSLAYDSKAKALTVLGVIPHGSELTINATNARKLIRILKLVTKRGKVGQN